MELPRLLRTGGTNQEPSRSALVATCVIFATPHNSFWAATMGDKFSIPMLRLYHSQLGVSHEVSRRQALNRPFRPQDER
jgi:hypothetical protein